MTDATDRPADHDPAEGVGIDVVQAAGDAGGERERTAAVVPAAYDADAVAAAARAADPGLDPSEALALARDAGRVLEELPGADAPEVARRLLASDPSVGGTPAAVVARAAVDAWSLSAAEPA